MPSSRRSQSESTDQGAQGTTGHETQHPAPGGRDSQLLRQRVNAILVHLRLREVHASLVTRLPERIGPHHQTSLNFLFLSLQGTSSCRHPQTSEEQLASGIQQPDRKVAESDHGTTHVREARQLSVRTDNSRITLQITGYIVEMS